MPKKLDTNNNGFIDKNEAMGPLKSDFIKNNTDYLISLRESGSSEPINSSTT